LLRSLLHTLGIAVGKNPKTEVVNNLSKKVNQLKAIYWTYIVIVGGYVLYGYATKTGPYAWLIDEQLKRFGKAYTEVAVLIPLIVLMVPIAPLANYVRRGERGERLQRPDGPDEGLTGPAANAESRSYWIWIGGFVLLPFLISLGAYIYLTAVDASDQKQTIYHMDLARSADLPAADAKFIEIAGVYQQDSEYNLQEDLSGSKSGHRYGPLTDPSWSSGQPVKYFLYLKSQGEERIAIGHYDKQTGRFDAMPAKGPYNSTFGGQLSRDGLPDYVKAALERRGIKTTEPYYVLDWKGDLDMQPIGSKYNSQQYYLIPFLGAFFSFVVFVGGVIAFVNRARQRARAGR
jgi:hypothetical protein